MFPRTIIFICLLYLVSCKGGDDADPYYREGDGIIRAVDISSYPELKVANTVFYDSDGVPKDFIAILESKGVNTVRLRLWANPDNGHSGLSEVKVFSEELKNKGFKIWLTLHYSDTWADPGRQELPKLWQDISYTALKDSVYGHTKKVVAQVRPDYIQIGNEINSGFLHPYGHIDDMDNFKELLQKGILAVRENSSNTQIIIHYAGTEGSNWFFGNLAQLDYDIIGLSYYPIWHGKSLPDLKSSMANLSRTYGKEIIIAETAYPFTLDWNDQTNNIVGLENQLILPDFPASEKGQRDFVKSIIKLTHEIPDNKGIGFCYWGAELISWKEPQATNGSSWENQALFSFENRAMPALEEFKEK